MSSFKCIAILKTGPNKGTRCCNYIKKEDWCGIHLRGRSPIYHPYNTPAYMPYRQMCAFSNFADQINQLIVSYYHDLVRSIVDPRPFPEDLSDEHYMLRALYSRALGRRVWYSVRKIQRAYREHLGRRRMKMIQLVLIPIIVRNK